MKNKNLPAGRRGKKILVFLFSLLLSAGFFGLYANCSADNPLVVINELMWMGSSVSIADEWIELKNTAPNPLEISGWKLIRKDTDNAIFEMPAGTAINDYLVIAEYDKNYSILNITPDLIVGDPDKNSKGFALLNSDLQIELVDNNGNPIDIADDGKGNPLAGEYKKAEGIYYSMERNSDYGDGKIKDNWHTCFKAVNLDEGASDCATPGAENSQEEHFPNPNPIEYSDQIIINEIFPAPKKDNPIREFVEFYNFNDKKINLKNWILKDENLEKKDNKGCILPDDFTIKANKYKEFYLADCKSNSIALTNSGDILSLYNPTAKEPVSKVEFKNAKTDLSYNFDGASWRWSQYFTPGEENLFNNLPVILAKKENKIYVNTYAQFSTKASDKDREKLKFTWDFGDGHKSYLQNTRHKYEKAGNYKTTLKVSDRSEDVFKTFSIRVINFPKIKIRIKEISPNPKGLDAESEYIIVKNEFKKKINLKGWSIATGSKNLYNHPITEDFILKPGQSKKITRKYSKFALANQKCKIEIRYPNGKVAYKLKYEKDKIAEDEIYKKADGKWAWIRPQIDAILALTATEIAQANPEETIVQQDIEVRPEDLGKQTLDEGKIKNRIVLASYGTHLSLPDNLDAPPRILGASTVRNDSQYFSFGRPYVSEPHWAVTFANYLVIEINQLLNKLISYF